MDWPIYFLLFGAQCLFKIKTNLLLSYYKKMWLNIRGIFIRQVYLKTNLHRSQTEFNNPLMGKKTLML